MNKHLSAILAAAAVISTVSVPAVNAESGSTSGVQLYRLYNPNSGEHLYTTDPSEESGLAGIGWKDEQEAWTTPEEGEPVYRLYNPNAGEHHYTKDVKEKNTLVSLGWQNEGVLFNSDETKKGQPVYREYNPNKPKCNHNYTTDKAEHDHLVSLGWVDEGIAFYAAPEKSESELKLEEAQDLLISTARTKIGTPYSTDTDLRCGPDNFDCSGFIDWIFAETGIDKTMLKNRDWTDTMNTYLLNQVENPTSSVTWEVNSPDEDDEIQWQKGDIILFASSEEDRDDGRYYHAALVADVESQKDGQLDIIEATDGGIQEEPEYFTSKRYPYIRVFRMTDL